MLILIFLYSLFNIDIAQGQSCDSIFENCGRSAQTTAKSLPSLGSAANFNPSNLAHINGLQAEILYRSNNKIQFNLLTGSSEVGAGLISPQAENAFFGNRSIELDQDATRRITEDKSYESKKLQFATGFALINTENFGLDLGASIRRNPDVKNFNLGAGTSIRMLFFNLGFHAYYDDVSLDFKNYINPVTNNSYSFDYNSPTYQEKFLVKTFSAGFSIDDFSFDAALINTHYDFYNSDTAIMILSSSLHLDNFLLNIAYRSEDSDNLKTTEGRSKTDTFGSLQYSWGSNIKLGVIYNNYLQKDITAQLIISF